MTPIPAATYTTPIVIADLEEGVALLRERGLRVSASRRSLLDGLLRAEGPVSAEYLAGGLGGLVAEVDLPSTYRNLELFERLGIVRHVHIGHGPGLYALVGRGEHSYVVCEACGELARLAPEEIEAIRARVELASGFQAHFSHFPILGLCPRCRSGEDHEGGTMRDDEHDHEHGHEDAHAHEHSHGEHTHSHPHDTHDHDHVEHEHEHSHGDRVHSHPHVHQEGLEDEHEHPHD